MSKVFVVSKVGGDRMDLGPAENFGSLEFINDRFLYADELGVDDDMPEDFLNRMVQVVRRFKPDQDYLLIAGDHLQMVTMSALLARAHRRFRVLRYDRIAKGYFPVVVDAR